MTRIETDYLVIGAGAVGMAFVDTLLTEDPDCHVTIVDKHAKPGGHWNDAYSFVTLHQPSATYGVNSMELGSDRPDTQGHNKGMAPLAAFVEANFDTDEERNAIIPVSPLTDTPNTYPAVVAANLRSMGILSQNAKVSEWNNTSRLHPSGPAIAKLAAEGSPKLAKLGEMMMTIQECAPAVMALGEKAMAEHLAT